MCWLRESECQVESLRSKEQEEFIDAVIVEVADLAVVRGDIFGQYLSNGEETPYETIFFRCRQSLSDRFGRGTRFH